MVARTAVSGMPLSASLPTTSVRLTVLISACVASARATTSLPRSCMSIANNADASRTALLTCCFEAPLCDEFVHQRHPLWHVLAHEFLGAAECLARRKNSKLAVVESKQHRIADPNAKSRPHHRRYDHPASLTDLSPGLERLGGRLVEFVATGWRRAVACFPAHHVRHKLVADAERPRNVSLAHALTLE